MADDLDLLFARARTLTPDDLAAADRVLARQGRRRPREAWRVLLAGMLATAAMAGGVVYVQRTSDLPTSVAYEVYTELSGEGW
jgi:hypothetical protein